MLLPKCFKIDFQGSFQSFQQKNVQGTDFLRGATFGVRKTYLPSKLFWSLLFFVLLSSNSASSYGFTESARVQGQYPALPRIHFDMSTLASSEKRWELQVFYWASTSDGRFEVWVDGRLLHNQNTRRRRASAKVLKLTLPKGTRHAWIEPVRGKVRIFGATLESGDGFILDKMAVSGSEMSQMLRIRPDILDTHLRSRNPDIWIMMFGSNDGYNSSLKRKTYAKTVSTLIQRFRKSLPKTPCILIGPMDSGLPRWRRQRKARIRLRMIRSVYRKAARKHNCAYTDFHQMMGGEGAIWRWSRFGFAKVDWIHMETNGYTYLARVLDSLLMNAAELPPLMRSHNPVRVPRWSRTKLTNQASLKSFYQKAQTLFMTKKGRVRMMLLGDSHLVYSRFDKVLRRLWQSRLGNGGPGWVQPASVNLNVSHLAGVRTLWTGNWKFSSILFPESGTMTKDLLGLGGRAFFSRTDRRARSYKRFKMMLPGIHGISDLWTNSKYGTFAVHRSLGRVLRMPYWKTKRSGWKISPWTIPTGLWADEEGLWLGCVDYKLGACRMPLQKGRLGAPVEYSDGVMKTIQMMVKEKKVRVRFSPTAKTFELTLGEKKPEIIKWRKPIVDMIFAQGSLWLLSSRTPHLVQFQPPSWKPVVASRWVMKDTIQLAYYKGEILCTHEAGRFLWRYHIANQKVIGPMKLPVRGKRIFIPFHKKEIYLHGWKRHIVIYPARSNWKRWTVLSMPGRVNKIIHSPKRKSMLWMQTSKPEALWRVKIRN